MNKYERAIDRLKNKKCLTGREERQMWSYIQELLNKVTPLKVINEECPNCGNDYYIKLHGNFDDKFNNCANCGQKLDWSDVNG